MRRVRVVGSALVSVAALTAGMAHAQQAPDPVEDVTRLSLEELAAVEVTSVSRRPEQLNQAAAAVFVITADDIRRSGAVSLPEVLRLAPNLDVQRVNAVDYAISARGFNGFETSNKLLVLIDGRSIYSTLSSGVFWDARDLPLENIERIEVISGPGGALYGANAMNGVINIITYPASHQPGTLASVTAGDREGALLLRHAGRLGESGAWRVFASGFRREPTYRPDGSEGVDDAEGLRVGGRADWTFGDQWLTLGADAFSNDVAVNEGFSGERTTVSGGFARVGWGRPLWGGDLRAQAYFEGFSRDEGVTLEESETWDVSLEHAVRLGRHMVVTGLGHRVIESRFEPGSSPAFLDPAFRRITLTSAFVQDQITLGRGVQLTLGAKFEDDSFSGQQFLPNVRLAWESQNGSLLWGAVSRASRTPNRIERDLTLPGFLVGGDFVSEELTAYEIGWRATPNAWSSFSISLFHNDYDHLRTASLDPVTVLPIRLTNFGSGTTSGVEAWGAVDVTPAWRVTVGVSTLEKELSAPPGTDLTGLVSAGDDPSAHGYVRSQTSFGRDVDLDVMVRASDDLAATDGYVEADVRLGWRFREGLELALVGRNLVEDRHFETGDPARRRLIGRSVHATLRATF